MNIQRKKATGVALIAASLVAGAFGISMLAPAQASGGFDPGYIISDSNFYTAPKMSVNEIRSFLNQKGAGCANTSKGVCLKNYRQNTRSYSADGYCPLPYDGGGNEDAATIIYKAAKACNIAPQVLLVTLQKEQSLITAPGAPQAYRTAMGMGCPDHAACDTRYYGLQNQVYSAARQFQIYRLKPYYFRHHAGSTVYIGFNPSSKCGGTNVYVKNQATASLYNYTPYQPNSLAVQGVVNKCGTYGNINFFNYYSKWFGDPRAAAGAQSPNKKVPVQPTGNTGTEQNTKKQESKPGVAAAKPTTPPVTTPTPVIDSVTSGTQVISNGSAVYAGTKLQMKISKVAINKYETVTVNGKVLKGASHSDNNGKLVLNLVATAGKDGKMVVSVGSLPDAKANFTLTIQPQPVEKVVKVAPAKNNSAVEKKKTEPAAPKPAEATETRANAEVKAVEAKKEYAAEPVKSMIINGKVVSDVFKLYPGDEVQLRPAGLKPGSEVKVEIHSNPIGIGMFPVNDQGVAIIKFKIPQNITAGQHHIVVGGKKVIEFTADVVPVVSKQDKAAQAAVQSEQLAKTGAQAGIVLIVSLLLLGSGVYMLVTARQNRPIRVNC